MALTHPPAEVTRSRLKEDQRQRILRATGELIAKRGFHDVTVPLLVKRAHVGFKTFYSHFSSKEDAFLALFDQQFTAARRQLAKSLVDHPDAQWPEQVILTLRAFVDFVLADPIVARACIVEAPTAGAVILSRYERATEAFVPVFQAGRDYSPAARELPSTIERTLAGSVLWSAYQRLILGEPERLEELFPELVELVLRPYLGGEEAARLAHLNNLDSANPVG